MTANRDLTAAEYDRLYAVALNAARSLLSSDQYDPEQDYYGDDLHDHVFSQTLDYADSTDDLSWVEAVQVSDIAGEAIVEARGEDAR